MIHPADSHPGGALRDYAFDELPHGEREAIEQHAAGCGECALELERLRVTTAALRTLPDREIPQRIAFVSDKVFEPSWFQRFWNSGAQLGFASACVLAVAMVISAWHFAAGTTEVRTIVQTAAVPSDQINAAVAKAVAQVRAEDAQMIQAAERKRDAEDRDQMIAINEYFAVQQKRNSVRLALSETPGTGAGQ
jgi:anti-sigma factor RsiW